MLPKVLRTFLILAAVLTEGVKAPHIESTAEPSAPETIYGPMPKPPEKTPSEKTASADEFTPFVNSKMLEATKVLDNMLVNYDGSLRPGIGKGPTVVNFTFIIHSFGPVSVAGMEYTIDATVHQTWYDERLSFNASFEDVLMSKQMMSQLWLPNLEIKNCKRSREQGYDLHTRMARVYRNGKVLHTVRMIIDIGCSIHMAKFPLDSHSCPLSFSSFFYTNDEVMYDWKTLDFNISNSWKLFEFDFKGVSNKSEIIKTEAGEYMTMTFYFNMTRRLGFITFHRYLPSSLTTLLSWIAFWIHKDSSPARVSIGVTSILTMTTISAFIQRDLQDITCSTVLDFYVSTCFVFCFFAVMEFAAITYIIYRQNRPRVPKIRHSRSAVRVRIARRERANVRPHAPIRLHREGLVLESDSSDSDGEEQRREEEWVREREWERLACPNVLADTPNIAHHPKSSCKWYHKFFCTFRSCHGALWQEGRIYIHVYRLDTYSRVGFPLAFIVFNIIYWSVCIRQ